MMKKDQIRSGYETCAEDSLEHYDIDSVGAAVVL